MSRLPIGRWFVKLGAIILLSACAAFNNGVQVTTNEPIPTPTSASIPLITPTTSAEQTETAQPAEVTADPTLSPPPESTPDPTAPSVITLHIWLPEPLAPVNNTAALVTLTEQIAAFENANTDLHVELRLKRPNDVGGILQTLRTASAVAPGALPDLTLMRRADLLIAGDERLIQPFVLTTTAANTGANNATSLIADIQPTAATLGMIDTTLYGLPYLIELQHIAYYADFVSPAAWTFDTLIEDNIGFTFPVGRGSGRSDVLITQVLGAGADTDLNAFLRLMRFYERASEAGLIDPLSLDALTPSEYRVRLANGEIRAAVVSSSDYLDLHRAGADLAYAPLPSDDGRAVTPLDGWMWVITTNDSARTAASRRLLDWLLAAERLATYSRAVGMLPATQTALGAWDADLADYATFSGELVGNAILPEQLAPAVARAMQVALIGVLTGEHTAEQAAQEVVAAS